MSCKQNNTLTHDDDESEIEKEQQNGQKKKEFAPTPSHIFQVSQNIWCTKSYISRFEKKKMISWKDRGMTNRYYLFTEPYVYM